jgi:hypothetical protein
LTVHVLSTPQLTPKSASVLLLLRTTKKKVAVEAPVAEAEAKER